MGVGFSRDGEGREREEGERDIPLILNPLHLIIHAKHNMPHALILIFLIVQALIRIVEIRVNRIFI
jgi:hypothetical protein